MAIPAVTMYVLLAGPRGDVDDRDRCEGVRPEEIVQPIGPELHLLIVEHKMCFSSLESLSAERWRGPGRVYNTRYQGERGWVGRGEVSRRESRAAR